MQHPAGQTCADNKLRHARAALWHTHTRTLVHAGSYPHTVRFAPHLKRTRTECTESVVWRSHLILASIGIRCSHHARRSLHANHMNILISAYMCVCAVMLPSMWGACAVLTRFAFAVCVHIIQYMALALWGPCDFPTVCTAERESFQVYIQHYEA